MKIIAIVIHLNLPPLDEKKNPAYLGRGSAGKAKNIVVSYLPINGEGTNSLGLENEDIEGRA